MGHYVKILHHLQNQKYNCNATKAGLSHGHKKHATKNLGKFGHVVFELSKQADRQTDRQTDKQTYSSHYVALLPWMKL